MLRYRIVLVVASLVGGACGEGKPERPVRNGQAVPQHHQQPESEPNEVLTKTRTTVPSSDAGTEMHDPLELGKRWYEQQRYEDALTVFEQLVGEHPEDGHAHLWRGRAQHALGKFKDAAASIEAAIDRAGDETPKWKIEAYRLLGFAYREAGNKQKAMEAWSTYLRVGPKGTQEYKEVEALRMALP